MSGTNSTEMSEMIAPASPRARAMRPAFFAQQSWLADSVGHEIDPAGAVAGLSLRRIALVPQPSIVRRVGRGQRCRGRLHQIPHADRS